MPRPPKIDEPTKTYNLLISVAMYDKLAQHAKRLHAKSVTQVSVGDLIREGIEIYIEALEDDDYDGGNSVGVDADNSTQQV